MCEYSEYRLEDSHDLPKLRQKLNDKYIQGDEAFPRADKADEILNGKIFSDMLSQKVEEMGNSINYDDLLNVASYFGAELSPLNIEIQLTSADMN